MRNADTSSAAAAARVSGAIASAVHYVRAAVTRENFDVALDKSAAFGRLVAQFGYEAAKSAVLRRVQRTVEEKVGGALSGAPTTPK